MKFIVNKNRLQAEPATNVQCPRCRGYGANLGDTRLGNGHCTLCLGHGRVWESNMGTGWYLPLHKRQCDARMY